MVRAIGNVVVIAFAIAIVVIELAGTLPAPALGLLAFSVVVPEVSPLLFPVALALALVAACCTRGRVREVAFGAAVLAALLALVPIAEFPAARAAGAAALREAGLGVPASSEAQSGAVGFDVLDDRRVRLRDGTTIGLDVYQPKLRGPRPTIVTIYGGAWIFGARRDTRRIDEAYAARGYTVVAIDYRHAPAARFPTQLDDVRDALAAIARNAAGWHVDPDRVALFGRSAGAELALLAAYEPEPIRIRAVVGYYAPTDLLAGYANPPRPDPADVRSTLRTYLGGAPPGRRALYRAASPVTYVRSGLPPTLLVVGLHDSLITRPMQRALRDALRAKADRVVAIELPWSDHAFDEIPAGLGTRIVGPLTRDFLAATLRPAIAEAARMVTFGK